MDDILAFGKDLHEHNGCLEQVLRRIQTPGATLNLKKCEFAKLISWTIQADPDKTAAIKEMKSPKTVSEIWRFLGMANQLGKLSRNLATLTQPLRELLSKCQKQNVDMLKLKRRHLPPPGDVRNSTSYILGTSFMIETDHKPLVPLLGTKNLDSLPPRILQFCLKLDRFDYHIVHISGKEIYTVTTSNIIRN